MFTDPDTPQTLDTSCPVSTSALQQQKYEQ